VELSESWIGVHRDMKENLAWFQDTYMNNNFANTGKYSFIQIQIDTGSTETYGGSATPYHGGDHGSSGIHMGFGTSQSNIAGQAPLGTGNYAGNTYLSLFANGNISQSLQSSASLGYVEMYGDRYISPHVIHCGADIQTTSDVFLPIGSSTTDTTNITNVRETHQFVVPFNCKISHAYAKFEYDHGTGTKINVFQVTDGALNWPPSTSDTAIGRLEFPDDITDDTPVRTDVAVFGGGGSYQFVTAGTALAFAFADHSSVANDSTFSIVLMFDPR
jgi:hypothetical protein